MATIKKSNLKKGLDTFITLPLMQTRYDKTLKAYDVAIGNGDSPREATKKALHVGVKGLSNPELKLRNAYEAAGVSWIDEVGTKPIKPVPIKAKHIKAPKQPAMKQVVTTTSSTSPVGLLVISTFIGFITGLIIGFIFAPLIMNLYQPSTATLVYWITLISLVLLGVFTSLWLTSRHLLADNTLVVTSSTKHA